MDITVKARVKETRLATATYVKTRLFVREFWYEYGCKTPIYLSIVITVNINNDKRLSTIIAKIISIITRQFLIRSNGVVRGISL